MLSPENKNKDFSTVLGTILGQVFAALGSVATVYVIALIISPLFGAIAGWVVGWFFGDTILGIFAQLGIHNVTMWQMGAFLGFVGMFFKPSCPQKKKEEKKI